MASWKKIIVSGSIPEFHHISASGDIMPITDNQSNLGSANREFKDLFIDGTAHIDLISMPHEGTVSFGGDGIISAAGNTHQIYLERNASGGQIGIYKNTPISTLDINGDLSVSTHITASGNISGSAASTASFGRAEGTSFSYVFDTQGAFGYDGDEVVYRNGGNEKFKVDNSQLTTETGNFTNLIKIGGENKIQLDESSVSLVIKQNDGGMVDNLTMTKEGELTLHRGGATINGDISGSVIRASGDVVAFNSSDKRLKDNIVTIGSPLQKIGRIGGYEFDWNENQHVYRGHDVGVIAQEIEEVIPEAVKDRDGGYKGVQYDKIIPLLIEGIKELTKKTKKLEKEIRVLRHKS